MVGKYRASGTEGRPALTQHWFNVCVGSVIPAGYEALNRCCFNVGPSSATLAQH